MCVRVEGDREREGQRVMWGRNRERERESGIGLVLKRCAAESEVVRRGFTSVEAGGVFVQDKRLFFSCCCCFLRLIIMMKKKKLAS